MFIVLMCFIVLAVVAYLIVQCIAALKPVSIKKPWSIAKYIGLAFVLLILSILISALINFEGVFQRGFDAVIHLIIEGKSESSSMNEGEYGGGGASSDENLQESEMTISTVSTESEVIEHESDEAGEDTEESTDDSEEENTLPEDTEAMEPERTEISENPQTIVSEIEISGNSFSGELVSDGQKDYYTYTPEVAGKYRFDFSSDNANGDYKFYVYSSDGKEVAFSRYSQNGKTVELSAGGEVYHIVVEQSSGNMQYTVSMGIPAPVIPVYEPVITGVITYTNQCNYYTFAAPLSGRYRFDFSSDNVECDYRFYLLKSDNDTVISSRFSLHGKSADLVEGETYVMIVEQSTGFPGYTITIGAPNPIQTISAGSFSGSISYTDQIDRYTYTAPVTGVYRFDLLTDNVQAEYRLYLYSSDETSLINGYRSNSGKNVSLVAGESYDICVSQSTGFENYTVNIGVPSPPVIVEGNVITGNILYTGQENTYIYTAPVTGNYIFTFGTNDATANYRFYVVSPINQTLASAFYSSGKKTVQLEGGQTYTITVVQYSGLPSYEIVIGVQE